MKNIITCICLMFVTGLMAQTTPMSSSEARKVNMSRTNGKVTLSSRNEVMTDSKGTLIGKSDMGVRVSAVDGGLVILGFSENSTARASKLKAGDVITAVNSQLVTTLEELNTAIATYEPGDVVTIKYKSGDRNLTKDVRLNRK
ncbi:PDZ domain-containing protein [Saprospiraceae bacterium]|nr:PDZ domain-containing protein [Saprospiraceae bacterium]